MAYSKPAHLLHFAFPHVGWLYTCEASSQRIFCVSSPKPIIRYGKDLPGMTLTQAANFSVTSKAESLSAVSWFGVVTKQKLTSFALVDIDWAMAPVSSEENRLLLRYMPSIIISVFLSGCPFRKCISSSLSLLCPNFLFVLANAFPSAHLSLLNRIVCIYLNIWKVEKPNTARAAINKVLCDEMRDGRGCTPGMQDFYNVFYDSWGTHTIHYVTATRTWGFKGFATGRFASIYGAIGFPLDRQTDSSSGWLSKFDSKTKIFGDRPKPQIEHTPAWRICVCWGLFYDLPSMVKVNTAKSLEEALAIINEQKDTILDVHRYEALK